MLYIFYVNAGQMLTFDMCFTLETVKSLKEAIHKRTNIPPANQVLVVSGGILLDPDSRVCSSLSGTDTSPIYMFSTLGNESIQPQPWPSIEDLRPRVQNCLDLPATYETVVARALIAQRMDELAHEEMKNCKLLVEEQHMQHQGWAAVIANMEDLTNEFRERVHAFYSCFDEHLTQRDQHIQFLQQFDGDLEILSRIPILPALMAATEKEFHAFDEFFKDSESLTRSIVAATGSMTDIDDLEQRKSVHEMETLEHSDEQTTKLPQTNQTAKSLLQWISARENLRSLNDMAQSCQRGLNLLDSKNLARLKTKVTNTISKAEQNEIKEIKGLEIRLQGLDSLLRDAEQIVRHQGEQSMSFQQNQNRARIVNDLSVLPDLCTSHQKQLKAMHDNHLKLNDIHQRIIKAKKELCDNLNVRLTFVVHLENQMSDLDNELLFYHRCMRRLQRHLVIIEQIHDAPLLYMKAVTEVVRRRHFSGAFLKWAVELAANLSVLYDVESSKRKDFEAIFNGHFLTTLFPGMQDLVPAWASPAPTVFDSSLPNLTKSDLELLSTYMPEITTTFTLPDLNSIIDCFVIRTAGQPAIRDSGHSMKDDVESETDTEEFEKVGQSPIDRRRAHTIKVLTADQETSTPSIQMYSRETLTEDNLGTSTLELERLKGVLRQMYQLSNQSMSLLRDQLLSLRTDSVHTKHQMEASFQKISETWTRVRYETESRERDLYDRMIGNHERQLSDLTVDLKRKIIDIDTLKSNLLDLEEENVKMMAAKEKKHMDHINQLTETTADRIRELEALVANAEEDKRLAVIEMKETLTRDHKTALESLRSRFKIMQRPSIDSPVDVIDLEQHDSIVRQLRDTFAAEIEAAVQTAVDRERAKILAGGESPAQSPRQQSDAIDKTIKMYAQALDEKERQLDVLREREQMLSTTNIELKTKIQQLTDSEPADASHVSLRDQIDQLQRGKEILEQDLQMERSRRIEMETSFAGIKGVPIEPTTSKSITAVTGGAVTSPKPITKPSISINRCSPGDTVMVVWNQQHGQYTIVQESPTMFFLHGDSLEDLNLQRTSATTDGQIQMPAVIHCLGRVIIKEFCQSRKDDNRYRVSKGTRFYRVKVRPCSPNRSESRKRERQDSEKSQHSSKIVSRSASNQLIDSFAQTDLLSTLIEDDSATNLDMVDSGVAGVAVLPLARYKGIGSSDDEPLDRCRYINVSEEDENVMELSRSDENTAFGGIGIFTLIEPLLRPIQLALDI